MGRTSHFSYLPIPVLFSPYHWGMESGGLYAYFDLVNGLVIAAMAGIVWLMVRMDEAGVWQRLGTWLKSVLFEGGAHFESRRRR